MTEATLGVAVDINLFFAAAPRADHFFFQLIRFPLVFLFAADVHCALVGRQAGYARLDLVADLRPHGLPVLQSIHPLPLFLLNHFFRLSPAAIIFSLTCCPSSLRQLFCNEPKPHLHKHLAIWCSET